jgi:DNA-binding NarL/FixJ family response regulator
LEREFDNDPPTRCEPSLTMSVSIMLVDDHALLREGLRLALEANLEFLVVAEAAGGDQALLLCQQHHPDVVIVDVNMPGLPVHQLVKQMRAMVQPPGVLVYTSHASEQKILELIKAGIQGYVPKDASRSELLHAVCSVAAGQVYLHSSAQTALMNRTQKNLPSVTDLTAREHSVLLLIARGMSNKAIARELDLTEGTVKGYVSQIFQKLQLSDRTEAAMYAVRQGWVNVHDVKK